jgi:hypothetical protein
MKSHQNDRDAHTDRHQHRHRHRVGIVGMHDRFIVAEEASLVGFNGEEENQNPHGD